MSAGEEALIFLAEQHLEPMRWRQPISVSITLHILGLLLLLLLLRLKALNPPPPVRILEVNIMGREDLALKGSAQDPGRGPLPEKDLLANPAKTKGPAVGGNTPKATRSAAQTAKPAAPAKPVPGGALFTRRGASSMEAGVGREKMYLATRAIQTLSGASEASAAQEAGEGLVGVPGKTIDLSAKRGGGEGAGAGGFIGGGAGSLQGGSRLQRKGESILVETPSISQELLSERSEPMAPLDPVSGFFSIRGPLSKRKILSMKLPKYPRWAEEAGIEALISVRLTVLPSGKVKPELMVEQTSGYPEFDRVAMDSLRAMRFAALPAREASREEWGVATFNFKLKKASRRGRT